jgi:GcrA cell cycle regulator
MTPNEARATLATLGVRPSGFARLLGRSARTVRHWLHGDRSISCELEILLRLAGSGKVALADLAAVAPARTNGSPPASLLVEPAPEQPALAPALANPSPTTAEKVYALTPEACRWPCGDPGHPDFHFCGDPVAKRPYCEHRHSMAYMTARTGGGHGARIRLVA